MLKRTLLLGSLLLSFPLVAQTVTNIAYLHTLLDPVNYLPTDTTNLYTVEGVVTTHTNLTTTNSALFYIQDSTAGIAVFVGGGAAIRPGAGDLVRVTGPLGHFNGLLELNMSATNTNHSVLTLDTDNPLPTPTPLEFSWQNDPATIEPNEGSYVIVSNVFLDLSTPTFRIGGDTVKMTNDLGETFDLRVDARTDISGQAKPAGPVTVFGVLGQFDTSNPRTSGYQLIPSRYADIVSASKAPTVRFTNYLSRLVRPGDQPINTFTEHALLPGEKLTMSVNVTDPEGRTVQVQPQVSDPLAPAQWTLSATSDTNIDATFTFEPQQTDAGKVIQAILQTWNDVATNAARWTIYVPTAVEQRIVLMEFLANPTANTNSPLYNPLRRDPPSANSSQDDEYIELANFSGADLDLVGWRVADAVQVRHLFYQSATLGSSNAFIVYGGPLNGFSPNLDVPSAPASEGAAELALNNTGSEFIVVYNADTNLVFRVVYTGDMLSANSSLTRYPDLDGAFVPQLSVSTNAVSPGRQYDGRLFSEPRAPLLSISNVVVSLTSGNTAALSWTAETSRSYTVWQADRVTDRFAGRFYGLRFTNEFGQFSDTTASNAVMRFYFITAP